MSKVRINDLARELEVKSRQILDVLKDVGVTEAKTHSSSLEEDEAERVRVFLQRGTKAPTAVRHEPEAKPKIDLSKVSKPGDVLRAIQARKEEAERAAHAPAPRKPTEAPVVAVPARPAVSAAPPAKATPVVAAPPAAEPRRIVPQPRQAPQIIHSAPVPPPAIATKPPVGPVVAKRPAGAAAPVAHVPAHHTPAAKQEAGVAAAPHKHVAPPVAEAPAVEAAAPVAAPLSSVEAAATPVAESVAAPVVEAPSAPVVAVPEVVVEAPPAPPVRRMIMPQTGPRPVYTAPPPAPASTPSPNTGTGIRAPERGKPIFDRRPGQPTGTFAPRPGGAPGQFPPGARRPMHPTRQTPGGPMVGRPPMGGPGGRPGFGAPRPGFGARPGFGGPPGAGGMMPPPGEAPRPPRNAPPKGRGGRQQYPKKQEGPMKGFAPPPRFGGAQIPQEPLPITRTITVTEGTSVKDLAEKLEIRGKDLIATLLMRGIFVTVNQSLDGELVKDVARQFGADANVISYEDEISNQSLEEILESDNIDELEVSRSPVVTVMGHVDHGKTSLLDAIRETEVAAGEAGGITQHIGAYKVKFTKEGSPANGREIVFLDTPGHEAFTRMRARGAKVTDLVVIVVAADDGVMPQTLEAVDHAKAAGVPIIVAINKIDKPDADPGRVKKQLADRGLIPDDWGGDVVYVEVSAKKRINLDLLLEMICLQSDLKNLKATPGRKAVGTVIEAKLDRGRGVVASVLVQNGTLHSGESFIMGNTFGKIRAMFDDRGRAVVEAGPSTPVEILGLEAMPDAGDTFLVVADRDKAKGIADFRRMKDREAQLAKSSRVSLEGLAEQIRTAGVKDLPLIIKGDVTGSVEVLADSLVKMSTEKVRIKVIRSGVGAITESDILLASASNAIVIGFNVRPERKAAELADQEKVEIRLHSIIYELQDEIRRAMFGLLDPTFKENYLGKAEILNIFKIPKVGTILGCSVKDGVIRRDAEVRILRKDEEVGKGKIGSLKRFKDDAKEVTNGMECGIGINGFSEFQVGDVIEAFTTEKIASDLGALSSEVTARAEAAAKAEAAASAEAEAAKP